MKKVLSLLVLSLCTALVALADGTVPSFATVGEGVTLVSATNDAAYPWDDTIVAGAITSTNKNHGSASAYVLNIESTSAIYVKLAYSVSSENNCDFLRILDGTTELYSFSGSSSNQTLEFLLKAGSHALTFKYTKDGSQSAGNDRATIHSLALTATDTHLTFAQHSAGVTILSETNEDTYLWSDSIPGMLVSTNHTAGTNSQYAVEFQCDTTVCVTFDYSVSSYNSENFGTFMFAYDGNANSISVQGTSSATGTYYFQKGTHRLTFHYYKRYHVNSSNVQDRATLSNLRLVAIEDEMQTIDLAAAGTLGTEALSRVDVLTDVRFMRLSGTLNSSDWTTIKNMTNLVYLDIRNITNTEIPASQFASTKMRYMKFPTGLKSIGDRAFYDAYLQGVLELPEGLESIGEYAFYRNALTRVTLPQSCVTLGSYAFQNNTSLTYFAFHDGITAIPANFLDGCTNLQTIGGCKNIDTVGNHGLSNCQYLLTLEDFAPTTIGTYAMYNCYRLRDFDMTQITTISNYGLESCDSLKVVTLPSVTSIGDFAFSYCDGLQRVDIGDNLTAMPCYGFYDCNALTTVVMGTSVASFSDYTFNACEKISDVYLNAPTPPTVANTPFYSVTAPTLYVPDYAMVSYKLDNYWSKFLTVEPNPYPTEKLRLSGTLELTSNLRIPDAPDLTMVAGSHLTVNGNNPQTFGTVAVNTGVYISNVYTNYPSTIVSRCSEMSAEAVTVSNYIGATRWYFVSFPFDAKYDDITARNGGTDIAFVVRRYDGKARGDNGIGYAWQNVTAGDTLHANQGYIVQLQSAGWLTVRATAESRNELFRSTAVTLPLDENPSLSVADAGWNLVGNPYPAYFDIWYMDYTAPITVWSEANKTYTAYSVADDDLALRPYQAFFVQRPQNIENVTFQPAGRQNGTAIEHGTGTPARRMAASEERYVMNLVLTAGSDSADGEGDRTRIVINPVSSDGYEAECDASKMMSDEAVPQLFTLRDGIRYAINEGPQDEGIVALGISVPASGTYTLAATRADREVVLSDALTGQIVTLDEPYTFSSDGGTFLSRFTVSFDPATHIDAPTAVESERMYDLFGRSVDNAAGIGAKGVANAGRGIYIVNGKKLLVR